MASLPGYSPFVDADAFGGCTFDAHRAELACGFFAELLTHTEGTKAGAAFALEPWQRAVVGNLFGWMRPDGSRRYREAFIYVPRKNGKTSLIAGVALYVLLCDGETGAQNYVAAADKDQAALLYRIACAMVRQEPELEGRCTIYQGAGQRAIVSPANNGFVRVLSAEAITKHGLSPHLVIVDELHAQPTRDLVDVLRTGQAARRQPLFIAITTADIDQPSICNETYERACRAADGTAPDPALLPVIYEAPTGADWTKERTWRIANPNLGVSLNLDYLRRECERAQQSPAYENNFRRFHLNQRTEQALRYVPLEAWDQVAGAVVRPEDLDGRDVYAGVDLASTTDLCAAIFIAQDDEGRWMVLPRFWCPADNAEARERRDRVPYLAWAKQGLLELTPGNVADYDRIRVDLVEAERRWSLRRCGIDPWNSRQLSAQLLGEGLRMVEVRQGFATMNEPTKELLRLVLGTGIRHGGNPILRWMIGNLAVDSDAAGNVKPTKARSHGRIDGVSALCTALAVAQRTAGVTDDPGMVLA